MPFPTRIQPIDVIPQDVSKPPPPPVFKSRLKRLFDRPLKNQSTEKQTTGGATAEFEPSSVCLDKMVQSFMEDNNEKQPAVKCGRNRCNCFNGNSNDSSDDELDFFSDSLGANSSFNDPCDSLKSLIPCASVAERNLLADISKIVEKNSKTCERKDDLRKIVTDSLISLGYNASICKSKWEKSSSIPAGEYEYIDVIIDGERMIIDVDFRSEFEIARSTSSYKAILQCLPSIFVGKSDRLLQILLIASEAARQSLKRKGMHIAPWRKADYINSKWLGPHTRLTQLKSTENDVVTETQPDAGELDLIFGEDLELETETEAETETETTSFWTSFRSTEKQNLPVKLNTPAVTWQLPELRPRSLERGNKTVVTGLAFLLKEKL